MLEALTKGVKGGKWYSLMDKVWDVARQTESARRIYDIRLALTLRHAGVRSFAINSASSPSPVC